MLTSRSRLVSLIMLVGCLAQAGAEDVSLTLRPDQVVNPIDEKVYGHFLEHIYHSVNGGLWGDLVWNRTFEQNSLGGWTVADGCIVQQSLGADQRFTFGSPDWTDYEFTLEAQKTGGAEGFLILFRCLGKDDFYWCNLGGWGNTAHQLERGRTGEGRWRGVGPRIRGSIDADRWYKIRVRCEASHIQVWLDGQPVIDFTDSPGHLAGKVGIGTWSTQVRFRNLKVTSLTGDVLFEGLPDALGQESIAQHWDKVGSGKFYVTSDDAANSKCSQRVVGTTGETGIAQGPLAVHHGETYVGSLFARGTAPEGLVVRLTDGSTTLSSQVLPPLGETWQEYPVSLPVSAASEVATLQIVLPGQGDVLIDQVSLMPQSWREAGGYRPDLLDAIAQLQPPVIRWPGGCFASPYRWKSAIGPQSQRTIYPLTIWDDQDVNSFGTDEFVAMCRRIGAEPLIVVNIGTQAWNGEVDTEEFLQEVRDWIEYCNGPATSKWGQVRAANGHPEPYGVKYWEIDNETWHMGAEPYAAAVKRFAPAMKQADPTLILAACGSAGYGDDANGLPWNRTIIEQCAPLIDYLSIHHYENPNAFAEGPGNYEAFFEKTGQLIAASANPQLKIYVSEWNAQSTDWRTGLYCGGLLNAFERCGQFLGMGGPALFLRHTSATDWDNAFINFDHRGWFPAPNYVVMKLWRDHYAPLRIALEGDARRLNVVATKSEEGNTCYLKAVNPTDTPQTVSLTVAGDFQLGTPSLQLVAPGSLQTRNRIEQPAAVRVEQGKVEVAGRQVRFTLPPLSAGVISMVLAPATSATSSRP
ncbi:MAG: family 16 glycoside hydrolase [Pirellulaceae bacterium]